MPFNWEGKFLLLQLIIYQERILFVAMVVIPLVARHKSSNLRLVFHWKHYYIAIHQSNLGMCMFCRWCSNYEWGNKYEPLDFGSSCRNGTLLKMLKGWHWKQLERRGCWVRQSILCIFLCNQYKYMLHPDCLPLTRLLTVQPEYKQVGPI